MKRKRSETVNRRETSSQVPQNSSNVNDVKEEGSDRLLISRRTFLGASALTTLALTTGCITSQPDNSILPPEESTGETITEKWVTTSCLNCPARCALQVRVANGKAVRITGNPLSKVSEGETCPRSHIGLQVLYDPDRVKSPLKRTNPVKGKGADPGWVTISWQQALDEVINRLKSLRDIEQPHKLLILHGLNSISNIDLLQRFADAYGTPNIIHEDVLENEAEKAGGWMADGHYTHSAYDLDRTNYILAFGASIIESQKPLARNLRMWGKIRRERPNRAKIVVIDPRYSLTAAKADQWLAITPGTDGALAMALANVIISEGLYDTEFIQNWTSGFEEYKSLVLSDYHPERVASITGIPADVIRQIAEEFARSKPAIAWRGRGATCWPNGSYTSYAIFCLNALVGSIDAPGGVLYQEYPEYRDMPDTIEDEAARKGKAQPRLDFRRTEQFPAAGVVTSQVADSLLADKPYPVDMAIGFGSNFNMSAPGTSRWDKALEKLPFYVHVAPSLSEMAEYADIILPASTFLEEWSYEHCPPGSGFAELKIKQPVVNPMFESRPAADIIFELAYRLGGATAQSMTRIGDNIEGFVRYRTETILPWDEFRKQGVWVGPAYEYYKYDRIFKTPSRKFEFYSGNLASLLKEKGAGTVSRLEHLPHYKEVSFLGDEVTYPLLLTTYHPLLNIENGNQNYPWAQEIFMVMHGSGWTNFVEINSQTALVLGIKDRDEVWVESPVSRVKISARVFEGIHPGVVAIASGQGHSAGGRWARGIGINPNELIGVDYDHISGQAALFSTRVRVYRA